MTESEAALAAVAARVGAFYEAHPYPPAVDDLDGYAAKWDEGRRRADYHLLWPDQPYRDDFSALVAGCGTSQAAKIALRWPRASVTGIDVSASSLAASQALKRRYGLDNLELHALPLERAGELGESFDQVICTGVLHHLPDPAAGLRALAAVLDARGALQLMVYAPYGRAGVYLIQEYCRRLGLQPTDADLRDLIVSLKALPPDHPLVQLLRKAPDFLTREGLADALLNPQDRAYSVPQLLDALAAAGLTFGRWQRQAPYLPQCGAPASAPHAPRLARLPIDEQYAALELFRGTMPRHTVVAWPGALPPRAAVDFGGDAWRGFVPVRVPDTIAVRENLPPGAVAVLINRTHNYTDLYLPIDADQARLLAAVDGRRTIAEIAGGAQAEAARAFFEQLWNYDQVVFDTSRC